MSQELLLTVQSAATLNEFLREELQERFGQAASNSKVRRLIFSQNVFVSARGDGFFVCKNPSLLLKKNARVKVFLDKEKFFYQKENDDIKFELDSSRVLYEDDAIIVAEKEAGFLSCDIRGGSRPNALDALSAYRKRGVVKSRSRLT